MGDLTENFSRSEFACQCGCGFDCVDAELVSNLEWLRYKVAETVGAAISIVITSGNRCLAHNHKEGGVDSSKHTKGLACDFKCLRSDNKALIDTDIVADIIDAEYPNFYGIGRYSNRVHWDMRKTKARWDDR